MDCTQALDDFQIEERPTFKAGEKKQLGSLEIKGEKYAIYNGENRIGRDPACSVSISSKALSKEHAVIEVVDVDNHLIYDLGSRNKTRLGKMILQPDVRYQLSEGSKIYLADVSAIYRVLPNGPKDDDDSGSETGSESMLNMNTSLGEDSVIVPETPGPSQLKHKKLLTVQESPSSSSEVDNSFTVPADRTNNSNKPSGLAKNINTAVSASKINNESIFEAETQIDDDPPNKSHNGRLNISNQEDIFAAETQNIEDVPCSVKPLNRIEQNQYDSTNKKEKQKIEVDDDICEMPSQSLLDDDDRIAADKIDVVSSCSEKTEDFTIEEVSVSSAEGLNDTIKEKTVTDENASDKSKSNLPSDKGRSAKDTDEQRGERREDLSESELDKSMLEGDDDFFEFDSTQIITPKGEGRILSDKEKHKESGYVTDNKGVKDVDASKKDHINPQNIDGPGSETTVLSLKKAEKDILAQTDKLGEGTHNDINESGKLSVQETNSANIKDQKDKADDQNNSLNENNTKIMKPNVDSKDCKGAKQNDSFPILHNESIFEAATQVINSPKPHNESIFEAATQMINSPKPHNESIFEAATQLINSPKPHNESIFEAATQMINSPKPHNESIFEAATQMINSPKPHNETIFEAATQLLDNSKPQNESISDTAIQITIPPKQPQKEHIFVAPTQIKDVPELHNESVFDEPTQIEDVPKPQNESIFEAETQLIESPRCSPEKNLKDSSEGNNKISKLQDKSNRKNIAQSFDDDECEMAATQIIEKPNKDGSGFKKPSLNDPKKMHQDMDEALTQKSEGPSKDENAFIKPTLKEKGDDIKVDGNKSLANDDDDDDIYEAQTQKIERPAKKSNVSDTDESGFVKPAFKESATSVIQEGDKSLAGDNKDDINEAETQKSELPVNEGDVSSKDHVTIKSAINNSDEAKRQKGKAPSKKSVSSKISEGLLPQSEFDKEPSKELSAEDDIYDALTQKAPAKKTEDHEKYVEDEDDVYDAMTQKTPSKCLEDAENKSLKTPEKSLESALSESNHVNSKEELNTFKELTPAKKSVSKTEVKCKPSTEENIDDDDDDDDIYDAPTQKPEQISKSCDLISHNESNLKQINKDNADKNKISKFKDGAQKSSHNEIDSNDVETKVTTGELQESIVSSPKIDTNLDEIMAPGKAVDVVDGTSDKQKLISSKTPDVCGKSDESIDKKTVTKEKTSVSNETKRTVFEKASTLSEKGRHQKQELDGDETDPEDLFEGNSSTFKGDTPKIEVTKDKTPDISEDRKLNSSSPTLLQESEKPQAIDNNTFNDSAVKIKDSVVESTEITEVDDKPKIYSERETSEENKEGINESSKEEKPEELDTVKPDESTRAELHTPPHALIDSEDLVLPSTQEIKEATMEEEEEGRKTPEEFPESIPLGEEESSPVVGRSHLPPRKAKVRKRLTLNTENIEEEDEEDMNSRTRYSKRNVRNRKSTAASGKVSTVVTSRKRKQTDSEQNASTLETGVTTNKQIKLSDEGLNETDTTELHLNSDVSDADCASRSEDMTTSKVNAHQATKIPRKSKPKTETVEREEQKDKLEDTVVQQKAVGRRGTRQAARKNEKVEKDANTGESPENTSSRPSRQRKMTWKIIENLTDSSQGSIASGDEKSRSRSSRSSGSASQNESNDAIEDDASRTGRPKKTSPGLLSIKQGEGATEKANSRRSSRKSSLQTSTDSKNKSKKSLPVEEVTPKKGRKNKTEIPSTEKTSSPKKESQQEVVEMPKSGQKRKIEDYFTERSIKRAKRQTVQVEDRNVKVTPSKRAANRKVEETDVDADELLNLKVPKGRTSSRRKTKIIPTLKSSPAKSKAEFVESKIPTPVSRSSRAQKRPHASIEETPPVPAKQPKQSTRKSSASETKAQTKEVETVKSVRASRGKEKTASPTKQEVTSTKTTRASRTPRTGTKDMKTENLTPKSAVSVPTTPVSTPQRLRSSRGKGTPSSSQKTTDSSEGPNSHTSTPKSSRNAAIASRTNFKVLFTGISDPKQAAIVKQLGGTVVDSPESCSVLVTDKVRRTYKFLCIMGCGKPIASPDWLLRSKQAGHFLDPWQYLVKDKATEEKYNFKLQDSLRFAERIKLLAGYHIYVTPQVKPPPAEMRGIIESCGGMYMPTAPPKAWPTKSFSISCSEDKAFFPKLKKSGKPVVGAESLLLGVVQQKLDLKTNKLVL